MLRRLTLRDFVIVRELDLEFDAGFTVLTGETGAGKSILIDALQLLLGGRADAGLVREGAARTEVSAEFEVGSEVTAWLEQAGFADGEGESGTAAPLLLRRTLDAQGRSRAWINGSAAPAAQLKELAEHLMLVDLARNDIGRVCSFGTIKVPEFKTIERYSHVMHIVSQVEGQLAPERSAFDLMRATFPAGTVS
ncbi:MAG: hypothetical protein RLZZ584_4479, partial [Pseudomonadota bacterium]